MNKFRRVSHGLSGGMHLMAILLVAAVSVSVSAPPLAAAPPTAKIIAELNATDEDVGLQIFFDGTGWVRLEVFDPDGFRIVDTSAGGGVQMQGITEFFFESAEPSLDELPLEDFLARFPEGLYTFAAVTVDGKIIRTKARFTHAIPDGPVLLSPQEDGEVDPDNTVVEWEPVADPPGSKIVGYQVIVVREKPSLRVFSADVSPETTSIHVAAAFMEPNTDYKFEVLAIETSGNQTLSEETFKTE